VVLRLTMTALSVYWLAAYGATLFFTTPVVIGACAGYFYNLPRLQSRSSTVGVASGAIVLGGLSSMLFALEGLVCV